MFGLFKKKRKQNNNVVSTQTTDLTLTVDHSSVLCFELGYHISLPLFDYRFERILG